MGNGTYEREERERKVSCVEDLRQTCLWIGTVMTIVRHGVNSGVDGEDGYCRGFG